MRRLSGGRSSSETESTTIRPLARRTPAMLSTSDVLPDPDGPTSAVTFASDVNCTSSAKCASGSWTSISISAMRASAAAGREALGVSP